MRTGIMGGTFDPIHHGHLFLANEVLESFKLDRVIFVPSKLGPHKLKEHHTAADIRYQMVERAIADHLQFMVSDIEIKRSGISYTIDTVRVLKDRYKSDKIYFITGADAIVTIEEWKDFSTLLSEVTFIAATRPSLNDDKLKSEIARLCSTYNADIRLMEMIRLEISSSDIRTRVVDGRPIRYLVPRCVEQMIGDLGLYEYQQNRI